MFLLHGDLVFKFVIVVARIFKRETNSRFKVKREFEP